MPCRSDVTLQTDQIVVVTGAVQISNARDVCALSRGIWIILDTAVVAAGATCRSIISSVERYDLETGADQGWEQWSSGRPSRAACVRRRGLAHLLVTWRSGAVGDSSLKAGKCSPRGREERQGGLSHMCPVSLSVCDLRGRLYGGARPVTSRAWPCLGRYRRKLSLSGSALLSLYRQQMLMKGWGLAYGDLE